MIVGWMRIKKGVKREANSRYMDIIFII
jgi:hypothetical protein